MTRQLSALAAAPAVAPPVTLAVAFAVALTVALAPCGARAQTGTTAYEFLRVPVSAHVSALGGNNVSAAEDDATFLFHNPALLANVGGRTVGFNYMSYMSHATKLSALFATPSGERGAWAAGAQYLSYGTMDETDEHFATLGTFTAYDLALQGGYTYMLSDRWSGGAQGKVLMSHYGDYSSMALAVDLGLNYYDADRGFSFSVVAQNLGGQVDALYEKREKLPFNLVVGLSRDLANAPIRLSLTLQDLTHWDTAYYAMPTDKRTNASRRFFNHVVLGADIFPSSATWIAVGYDFRRAYEMKVLDKSHWAGISVGAGLNIRKFKVGVAYAKYHLAASSLLVNASYAL